MLIGLTGKAGAGKSSLSKFLIGLNPLLNEGKPYTKDLLSTDLGIILPFAKSLKDLAIDIGWDGVKDQRGRKLLQSLGTDVIRAYNPNWHIDQWLKNYNDLVLCKDNKLILVDDVRFENEVKTIQELGGYIIYCANRAYDLRDQHASEQVPQYYDYVLDSSKELDLFLRDGKFLINLLNGNLSDGKCPHCSIVLNKDYLDDNTTKISCLECKFNIIFNINNMNLRNGLNREIHDRLEDYEIVELQSFKGVI